MILGGYDSRFAAIKDINDFVVSLQNDRDGAGIVLYGCQEGDTADTPRIVLGSGKTMAGTIKLPSSVTEIFGSVDSGARTLPGAFEETGVNGLLTGKILPIYNISTIARLRTLVFKGALRLVSLPRMCGFREMLSRVVAGLLPLILMPEIFT